MGAGTGFFFLSLIVADEIRDGGMCELDCYVPLHFSLH